MKQESLIQELLEMRMTAAMEQNLWSCAEYQMVEKRAANQLREVQKLCGENTVLQTAIDDLVSIYNQSSTIYGRVAFQQGFFDAVKLNHELFWIGYYNEI